jgi:hypothetical protein
MKWDADNDKSSCRKYHVESQQDLDNYMGLHYRHGVRYHPWCDCDTGTPGYLFEIYDRVIDVPNSNPDDPPIVEDNRFIASVFMCDRCYAQQTKKNY